MRCREDPWVFVELRGRTWIWYTGCMKKNLGQIQARLTSTLRKQQELSETLQGLLQDPEAKAAAMERVDQELSRLAARRTELLTELRLARTQVAEPAALYPGLVGQRPMREQVLDILDELTVPSSPRVISEVAVARYGRPLPPARFASLRRDEERAWRKDPLSRPAWVVPALSTQGLTSLPRIVGSSAWPAERRLIGARTLRTNHLRTLLALLSMRERSRQAGSTGAITRLDSMILGFAQTVPGAVEVGKSTDYDRVIQATKDELAFIEEMDFEERRTAARRLENLPELHRLWGNLAVIEGQRASGGD
jgi:hypothetical protein